MAAKRIAVAPEGADGFSNWLSGLTAGPPQSVGELTLIPLSHVHAPARPDRLIDEAILQGQLDLVEQGSGTVQQVLARNHGDVDVLVLEGDTLVGCKQNRMVAWSVLVGAGTSVPISVGCMERGRWNHGGAVFHPGAMAVDPHIRRRSKRETSASMAYPGGPRLDQGRAWSDVDGKLREWHVSSDTDDYYTGLMTRMVDARVQLLRLKPEPGQVGVIALHGDRLLGLETVAHPDTWAVLAGRVLPAYALGAESARLDPDFGRTKGRTPAEWLGIVGNAGRRMQPAKGKGYDLVLRAPGITGSCLWHEGAGRHLTVFPD